MKILIVDRVQLFQKIIASVLDDTEIDYEFADSGQAALFKIAKEKYEIICISMYLDDMNGIELSSKIRQISHYTYTPIVLITSEESTSVIQQALKSGITDVFEKQDADQLVNFIRRFGQQNNKLTGHVLYIEDTLSQRLLVTEMLSQRGLKVDGFASGEEAFAAFIKNNYDLVITDIILDGSMSGFALANRIRRLEGDKGDVPILAVTAFDNISRRISLFHLGINDYVIKPIVEEELLARIKSLIENRHFVLDISSEKTRALQANAAKSEFLSLMSHELRTPLNSIIGNLQLMLMDAKGENISNDFLECIHDADSASHHLLGLVNEILDLSKIEAGKMEISLVPFNPKEVILSSIDIIKHAAAERGINLHQHFIEDLPDLIADSARLKQVLINLLSNAVKYNHKNGDIFVSTHYKPESNTICIRVRDTGPGLTKEECAVLFEKFNRGGAESSSIEGTGLGLYVTKKMVNEMQGELTIKSKQGAGTLFTVQLPGS